MEKSEEKCCWSPVVNEGDGKARNTIGRQVEKVISDGQTGRQLVASGSMFFCFYFNLLRIQGDGHGGRHFVARCKWATARLVALWSPLFVCIFGI